MKWLRDFDEARGEAAADGDRALWILRLLMAVDLVRTVGIQWLRSGFPAIGLASILVTLALAEGLATLALRARFAPFQMPANPADAEILGLLLLAVISVMLIAMTIVAHASGSTGRDAAVGGNGHAPGARADEAVWRPARARSGELRSPSR